MNSKPVLAGLLPEELAELLNSQLPFRSRQIYEWICRGAASFEEMKNLPLSLRNELMEKYSLYSGTVVSELQDRDGTVKLGISFEDGVVIEGVILSDGEGRKTACLSTQAGCPLGCVFCKTGKLGFRRNLAASEISEQFLQLKKREQEISHIVIMGMGEPLLNLQELKKALHFFMDPGGLNISKRRITISTSGIEKGILDLADHGPDLRLALSLTAARKEIREKLMPVTCENPLPRIKASLLYYQKKRKSRITLEIVLLGGINTSPSDAQAIADFARGLDVVINLISWNPVDETEFEGIPLKAPAAKEAADFKAALEKAGLKVTRRMEKGRGISGACGQLGTVF